MSTKITPERDAKNRLIIQNSFGRAFGLGLTANQVRLLSDGTPEERAAYVNKKGKHLLIGIAAVGGYIAISLMMPRDLAQLPPAPEITDAGQIQSLQLHETALSTSTTVVSTTGTYQVRGGVSATAGDAVTLKRETYPTIKTSLCVESKIKNSCYQLL